MSLLQEVNQVTEHDNFKHEVINTQILSISQKLKGKFGHFRRFECTEGTFNVDAKDCAGIDVFVPDCQGAITVTQYTNSAKELKTFISALTIIPSSGLFMSSNT